MLSYQIRPATHSDIPKLLPMIAQICALHQAWDAAKYGFLPNPERRYEGWLGNVVIDRRDLCLVADINLAAEPPQLGAFLIATVEREIPIYLLKEFGFIHDIWVEPDCRKSGIAHQMVKQAIAHFTQLGVKQIRLDTAMANETARQLFVRCGFRASTLEMLIEI